MRMIRYVLVIPFHLWIGDYYCCRRNLPFHQAFSKDARQNTQGHDTVNVFDLNAFARIFKPQLY